MSSRSHKALHVLSNLPQRMLSIHGHDNLSEFVLHELCSPDCFNLSKAAYFVDNPDFDCCKGITGFSNSELFPEKIVWQHPESFTDYMKHASFNQRVRSIVRPSYRKCNICDQDLVDELAQALGVHNPGFYAWDLKHDNHGILIFEKNAQEDYFQDYLHGLYILGFCPVH